MTSTTTAEIEVDETESTTTKATSAIYFKSSLESIMTINRITTLFALLLCCLLEAAGP